MLKNIKGVVVSTTPFKENSKILNVITEDGIIGIMSKGCKNLKSPLRIISEKLSYAEFVIYYKENSLSTLKEGTIIDDFKIVKTDLKKISYVSYLTELVYQVMNQNDDYKDIYDLYINTILKINNNFNPKVMANILELKLLDYLGVPINFDCCNKCGDTGNIVTIDGSFGGFLCKKCRTNEPIYDAKVQKMLRMYYLVDINNIKELRISDSVIEIINEFITDYYDNYTGLYLKSKKMLDLEI